LVLPIARSCLQGLLATMLGSAAAGMLARIPCHPIDTVKARVQVRTDRAGTYRVADAARAAWASGGLRGLYRGFGVAFVGSAPGALLYFTTYEAAKRWLSAVVPAAPLPIPSALVMPTVHLTAGMAAEAVSCLFWVPIDVIKERMQVQGARPSAAASLPVDAAAAGGVGYYRNTLDAVRQITAREGLRGVYRGYWATVASFGPFSALYFALYEQMKAAAQAATGVASDDMLPFGWQLTTACAAGLVASFLTSPLDLAKLRLQVQRGSLGGKAAAGSPPATAGNPSVGTFQYTGMRHALASIVRQEGWRALFRGAGARMAYHAPTTAITMALFERCRGAAEALLLR